MYTTVFPTSVNKKECSFNLNGKKKQLNYEIVCISVVLIEQFRRRQLFCSCCFDINNKCKCIHLNILIVLTATNDKRRTPYRFLSTAKYISVQKKAVSTFVSTLNFYLTVQSTTDSEPGKTRMRGWEHVSKITCLSKQ